MIRDSTRSCAPWPIQRAADCCAWSPIEPGLSTAELAERTKDMTRWGVMKHLAVLESAGLIQTMPEGRRRRHFHEPQALDPLRRWLNEDCGLRPWRVSVSPGPAPSRSAPATRRHSGRRR